MQSIKPNPFRWAMLAAVLICLALPTTAGARAQSLRIPVDFIFFNACFGGEEFTVKGTAHAVFGESRGHTHSHFKMSGSGVSPDGTRYRFTSQANEHFDLDFSAPGAQQAHFISRVTINRQGSGSPADDVVQDLDTHLTENANGEITAEFERFEVDCH